MGENCGIACRLEANPVGTRRSARVSTAHYCRWNRRGGNLARVSQGGEDVTISAGMAGGPPADTLRLRTQAHLPIYRPLFGLGRRPGLANRLKRRPTRRAKDSPNFSQEALINMETGRRAATRMQVISLFITSPPPT